MDEGSGLVGCAMMVVAVLVIPLILRVIMGWPVKMLEMAVRRVLESESGAVVNVFLLAVQVHLVIKKW
jgi:hypothetical protein